MKTIKNKKIVILIVLAILIVGSILLSFLFSERGTQSKYTKNTTRNYPFTSSKMYISSNKIVQGSTYTVNDYDGEDISFQMYNYSGSNISNVNINYGIECTTNNSNYSCSITNTTGSFTSSSTQQTNNHSIKVEQINTSTTPAETVVATLKYKTTYPYGKEESCTITLNNLVAQDPVSFATDSWATIVEAARTGNTDMYNVGDEKDIDMGTYGTLRIRIANMSSPTECSSSGFSQTACGFVLEFKDIITTRNMNSTATNAGGWPATGARTFVNNDIYNILPTALKNGIINTTVVSGHGSTTGESNFTSTDKLYLLSSHEIWKDVDGDTTAGIDYNDTSYNNTRQLDYYLEHNVTTSSYSEAIKNYNGSVSSWWNRSSYSLNTSQIFNVGANGHSYNNGANNSYGISPAFRIEYNPSEENSSTFANDSWETIIENVKSANVSQYNVGDSKKVNMGSLGNHRIRIANKSIDSACYSTDGFSQTACGFVLEFKDIVSLHEMNSSSTNVGGWPASSMRTYVNSDIYNSLPTVLKNGIINTSVVSGHGSTSGETNFTSTDKLYLLSTHEVWSDDDGTTSSGIDYYDTAYNNTRQLDYYAGQNITINSYSDAIKKYNGTDKSWWIRSARSNYGYSFFYVYGTGRWNASSANYSTGVSPAFRLQYDNVAPTKPTVQATFKDGSGSYTSGSWTNKEVQVTVNTTDNLGIAKIQVSKNSGSTWTDVNFDVSELTNTSGNNWSGTATIALENRDDTMIFRAVDKSGNNSESSDSLRIKYDIDAPVCTLTANSYNTIGFSISDARSGIASGSFRTANGVTTTYTSATSGIKNVQYEGTYTLTATDAAGNTSTNTINAYTISRSQGTGTTLTTRVDSTSSSSGTAFSSSVVALVGTSIWAKAVANTEYENVVLKRGDTTMNASGEAFTVGQNITVSSTASQKKYTISFDADGGTGGQTSSVQVAKGAMMPTISTTPPSKTNKVFLGWALDGVFYYDASGTPQRTWDKSQNATLVAQYSSISEPCDIIYHANPPSSGLEPYNVPDNVIKMSGETYTIADGPSLTGYQFVSWNTQANGNGTSYSANSSITVSDDLELYAQWRIKTYTVTYHANTPAGTTSGMPSTGTKTYNVDYTISSTTPTNTLYTFNSWNTQENGGGTTYAGGDTYSTNANLHLYAQWNVPSSTIDKATSLEFRNSPYISNIKTMTFNDTINTPASVVASWDVSAASDSSIIAYVVTNADDNTKYDLYIEANGKIMANADNSSIFSNMTSLTTINNMSIYDTSNVTNMGYMFYYCQSLTTLDLSSFDTSNVTSMGYMFYYCQSLTTLDLNDWDTRKVTNISTIFAYCKTLTTLNISDWDTSKVSSMVMTFYYCKQLTSIDIANWDTSSVTDMRSMFDDCQTLTTLDVSSWNVSNVTNMEYMFSGCYVLSGVDVSNWNTRKVTTMSGMFNSCREIETISVDSFDTTNVTNMYAMFSGCSSLLQLDLSDWDTSNVTTTAIMFSNCTSLISLDISNFNTSNVTDMQWMFLSCSSLTTLDISSFDTSKVTNTSLMFEECRNLTALNISNFDMTSATNMNRMFSSVPCAIRIPAMTGLIDNTTTRYYGKTSSIYATGTFIIDNPYAELESAYYMGFKSSTYITNIKTITFNNTINTHSSALQSWDVSEDQNGSIMAYLETNSSDNTKYDLYIESYQPIYANSDNSSIFSNMTNLTTINNMSLFNTKKMTSMQFMFYYCQALTSVDLSNFNTKNVTSLAGMFSDCNSLINVDLSALDTSQVTTMSNMFCNCYSIQSIDFSGVNTSSVTSMNSMFEGCILLTSLDISMFDTTEVTIMGSMFFGCRSLQDINVSNFDTSNVSGMDQMFCDCENLVTLNLSNFDTSNVTSMPSMFLNCSGLTSINLSSFDTSQVTNMINMFCNCNSLTSLNLSSFDTSSVRYMGNMFHLVPCTVRIKKKTGSITNTSTRYYGSSTSVYADGHFSFINDLESASSMPFRNSTYINKIRTITFNETINTPASPVAQWDISKDQDSSIIAYIVTNASESSYYDLYIEAEGTVSVNSDNNSLFKNMQYLKYINNIDLLDTSKMTSMYQMFYYCTSLLNVDCSSFNTSKVTNMSYMFYYCNDVQSINVTSFDTSKVTDMKYMFDYCYDLTTLDVSGFNTSKVTNMGSMFDDCRSLTIIDVSEFDTSKVTDMSGMFDSCYALESLDLSNFDTSLVRGMYRMFAYCRSLTSLDLSNFTTNNNSQFNDLFYGCTGLIELDVSGFDVSQKTDLSQLFYNCKSLQSLDITNFDTSSATNMTNMFYNVPCAIRIPNKTGTIQNTTTRYYGKTTSVYADGTFIISGLSSNMKSAYNMGFRESTYLTNIKTITFNDSIREHSNAIASWDISENNDESIVAYVFRNSSDNTKYDLYIECNGIPKANADNSSIFSNMTSLTTINNLSILDTSKLTSMESFFYNCESLEELDLSENSTSRVTDMNHMFYNCNSLENLDISGFNRSKVTDMSYMFANCELLSTVDLTNLNTSLVTDTSYMFSNCSLIDEIEVIGFNTRNITNMSYMFNGCSSLTSLNVDSWVTNSTTNMSYMFSGCSGLTGLDLKNFNTSNVTNMTNMFYNVACSIYIPTKTGNIQNTTSRYYGKTSSVYATGTFILELVGYQLASANSMGFRESTYLSSIKTITFNSTINTPSSPVAQWDVSEEQNGTIIAYILTNSSDNTKYDLYIESTGRVLANEDNASMFKSMSSLTTINNMNLYDISKLTSMYQMFSYCSSLTSIDMSNWNTSVITNMSYMFWYCSSLTSLNFTNFNTSKVTNMSNMFSGCRNLTSLNITNFNTSNVTDMSNMFSVCYGLTSLDVSSFNTSKVITMEEMFSSCLNLEEIDVSGFDTRNVTNMSKMFCACYDLIQLDLSSWNTSKVTDMLQMFGLSNKLQHIDVSSFDTSKVTDMQSMFGGCTSLVELDISNFDASNVYSISNMFNQVPCSVRISSKTGDIQNTTSMYYGKTTSYYATGTFILEPEKYNLKSAYNMGFRESTYLTNIKTITFNNSINIPANAVQSWDISEEGNGTIMAYVLRNSSDNTKYDLYIESDGTMLANSDNSSMFSNMTSLTTINNVNLLDTRNITSMANMFYNCSSLISFDLSDLKTSKVTDMSRMFYGCQSLATLNLIGISTSRVNNMSNMFYNCSSLETIDLSSFSTSQVTDMSYMFANCTNVEELIVGSFNTQNVTKMNSMFSGCQSLATIDVTGFDTSQVTDMGLMFNNCSSIDDFDISNFNASKVTNMTNMFNNVSCSIRIAPKTGSLSNTTTRYYGKSNSVYATGNFIVDQQKYNLKSASNMGFRDASYLTNIKTITFNNTINTPASAVANWDISENNDGTVVAYIIRNSSDNTKYDLFIESYGKVCANSDNESMFNNMTALTTINNINLFDTSKLTSMANMFYYCQSLTSLDLSNFKSSNVTDMNHMFYYCSEITSINLSGINTSKVTNMSDMFTNCQYLPTLNLSNFVTGKVTNMSRMFYNCKYLNNIDVSGWNTSNVTNMEWMFCDTFGLTSLNISNWNTSKLNNIYVMFSMSGVKSLDLSNWDTSKVSNMSNAFASSDLEHIYFDNWNTSNVKNMEWMFSGCTELVSLDISSFDASNVTYMSNMFKNVPCSVKIKAKTGNIQNTTTRYYGKTSSVYATGTFILDLDKYDLKSAYNMGFKSSPYISNIKTITFNSTINTPASPVAQWDISEAGDLSIIAYVVANSSDNTKYDLYIESNGEVRSNEDNSSIFSNMTSLTTINNINLFNTCKMTSMSWMFYNCSSLTSLNLNNFDTKNVSTMSSVFYNCVSLTTLNLNSWNTSQVTTMYNMFYGCDALTSLDLSGWNTGKVTNFECMFYDCDLLASINVSGWNTSNATDMTQMFCQCRSLTSLNLSSFNTSKVTSMSSMFRYCPFTTIDLSSFDGSKVETTEGMFYACGSLTSIQFGNFGNTLNESMEEMFGFCNNLTSLDLSSFSTSNVTNMHYVFYNCYHLTSLDLSNFDTSNVTTMEWMFNQCSGLTSLNISSFDTSNVTNMNKMFAYCSNLASLDISNFDASAATNMTDMFINVPCTVKIYSKTGTIQNTTTRYYGSTTSIYATGTFELVLPKYDLKSALNMGFRESTYLTNIKTITFNSTINTPSSPVAQWDISAAGDSSVIAYIVTNSSDNTKYDLYIESAGRVSANEDNNSMFKSMTNLTTINNMNLFDTSKVTSMEVMFNHCQSLTSLDLSSFDTSKVTKMNQMFYNCKALTSLNLSSFNTNRVSNMSYMFGWCQVLTTLDLSNFNTSNVTDMNSMFNCCQALTTLNLSNFNTSNVTDMHEMFNGCQALTTLNINNFNTSKVTYMHYMFSGCRMLTSLNLTHFDTSKVTNMSYMFLSCQSLTSLNVSNWNTSLVTDMSRLFSGCNLSSINVSSWNTSLVTNMSGMFQNNTQLSSLNLSNFNTSNVTNMSGMFNGLNSLTNLNISNFNTSKVTDMSYMFAYIYYLTTLDLSHFDTSKVTNMSGMFSGDRGLSTINLSSFDTSIVTDMSYMFSGCTGLTSLDISNFDASAATNMYRMFFNDTCTVKIFSLTGSIPNTTTRYYGSTTSVYAEGTFELVLPKIDLKSAQNMGFRNSPYISNIKTITFNSTINTPSSPVAQWDISAAGDSSVIAYVVANSSDNTKYDLYIESYGRVSSNEDNSSIFSNMTSLTTINNINLFDTSKMTSMGSMFYNCSSLTALDLSNFDTSNVTSMASMFNNCSGLSTLDLSNFDTSNVTSMSSMFAYCTGLTSLNLSNFNTNKVTNMNNMFFRNSYLTALDLSHFNTSNVTNMRNLFNQCSRLATINVSGWNTAKVTDMSSMFHQSRISTIDVSSFNTSLVTNMDSMFGNCTSLTTLDLNNFNTSNVTNMSGMFNGLNEVTSLNISSFNTSKVTDMSYMFSYIYSLTTLDLSHFDTSKVTNMSSMFSSSSGFRTLNLSNFNTSLVTNMSSMFNGCRNLTSLNISNFDASAVTSMSNMFYNVSCTVKILSKTGSISNTTTRYYGSTTSVYATGTFELELLKYDLKSAQNMGFRESTYLTNIKTITFNSTINTPSSPVAQWDISKDGDSSVIAYIVTNSSDNTKYDLYIESAGKVSSNEDNRSIFSNMTSLTTINNINLFDTSKMTSMGSMFYNCTSLTALDLSNFDTSNVTSMASMFEKCSGLSTLDLSDFDTSNVTSMSSMFAYCTGLTSLNISNFNTSKVTNMSYMFFRNSYLTALDLSHFNTSNVTNMNNLFNQCYQLATINVSGWNTAKVTDMSYMFHQSRISTIDVSSFNTSLVTNMDSMFGNCTSLTTLDLNNFNTSNVTNMSRMFNGLNQVTSLNISNFNTSKVTNMSYMFSYIYNLNKLNLNHFNTSAVTNMSSMFSSSSGFRTLNLSSFNTSLVTNMSSMFNGCRNLTSLNLSSFDTSAVTNMSNMFSSVTCTVKIPQKTGSLYNTTTTYYGSTSSIYATGTFELILPKHELKAASSLEFRNSTYKANIKTITFNQSINTPSNPVASWDVSKAQDSSIVAYILTNSSDNTKYDLFIECNETIGPNTSSSTAGAIFKEMSALTTINNIELLDISSLTSLEEMFYWSNSITSLDLSEWDTSNVTDMTSMFLGCKSLTSLNISGFDTSKVTSMCGMFTMCEVLTSLDVSGFDTSKVIDMERMFCSCETLTSLDLSGFDTSKVTNTEQMFDGCEALTSLDVSGFDTSNVKTMAYMFDSCKTLTSLDVSGFNTSEVTDMRKMFYYCQTLTSLDVSGFDTGEVTNMNNMFNNCINLTSLNVNGFDTSKVTDMQYMFYYCQTLTSLDVSGFDTGEVTNMSYMFCYCYSLTSLDVSGFDTSKVQEFQQTFCACDSLNSLDISNFDLSSVYVMSYMFDFDSYTITIPSNTGNLQNTTTTLYGSSENVYLTGTYILHTHNVISRIEPTCTESGLATYSCTNPTHSGSVVLPALGHNYVNGVCSRCGELVPPEVIIETRHGGTQNSNPNYLIVGTWDLSVYGQYVDIEIKYGIASSSWASLTRGNDYIPETSYAETRDYLDTTGSIVNTTGTTSSIKFTGNTTKKFTNVDMATGTLVFKINNTTMGFYGIYLKITPSNIENIIETTSHTDYGNNVNYQTIGKWNLSTVCNYVDIEITYQTESTSWDWFSITAGNDYISGSSYTETRDYLDMSGNIVSTTGSNSSAKIGGTTKTTVNFVGVRMPKGTVVLKSDSSNSSYYGIYVKVTPSSIEQVIETSSHTDYGNNNNYIVLGTWDLSSYGSTVDIEITYQTEGTSWDWVSITSGTDYVAGTSYSSTRSYLDTTGNIVSATGTTSSIKFGGSTKTTKKFTNVAMPTGTVVFRTDGSGSSYYGAYVKVTPH